jgi:regulator of protease activity HflC (stomatin/prohibitin superfamily)
MQSASPPPEVVAAIKDRMVAVQRQEQAQAEAVQRKTLADAEYYAAQKEAEAAAYRITQTAEAEARRISLAAVAQQQAVRALLSEMQGEGELAVKYIDYLIAQELKENSKWIISGGDSLPILDLHATPGE